MKGLEKRFIKRMNTEVTFIGFGALEIGRDWGLGAGNETAKPSDESAGEVLNKVLDIGINLVDTASAYHRSEERIGKYISNRRNEYVLASKCGEHSDEPRTYYDYSYSAIKDSIDKSLLNLKTDVIDLMQIHFGPEPENVIEEGETVRAMRDAQKEGKVKYLGASIDGELAKRCILSGHFDVIQMDYNLLNTHNENNIKLAYDNGIGVFIRSGLSRGLLSKRVLPHIDEINDGPVIKKLLGLVGNDADRLTSLALNFLYRNKFISSILLGTKNVDHLQENFAFLEKDIDDELINKAIEIVAMK